jgi:outer membrane protein assembly factor BamD
MKCWSIRLALILLVVLAVPYRCPAPLIYRVGEGWSYEAVGGTKWERARAKDQMEVARQAYEKKQFSVARKAARRVVKRWPYSDYAPEAQYLLARIYAINGNDEKAFKEYQKLIEKYPKVDNYQEVLRKQYDIANRYLAGQWFKLWGVIPLGPSMDKTVAMYEKVIKNGQFSEIAPQAQLNIGAAHEKRYFKEYIKAAQAYEKAADRYHDQPKVAAEAQFKTGMAYTKQARTSEYDQSVAGKAIAAFSDFNVLYPDDARVPESQKIIASLKTEQARGCFAIAKFYEKRKRWNGALIYYNEVLVKDPDSTYAIEAKQHIEALKKRTTAAAATAPAKKK